MTEDTIALQTALSNLSSGDTFEVPGREYVIEGEITSPQSGITINYGSATFQQTKEYSRTFVFPDAKDVTVLGGTGIGLGTEHNGTRTSFNNVAFLYFDRDCSNIRLENITARNHAGGSIRWGGGRMKGLKASGCTLEGIGARIIKPGDNNDDVGIGSYMSLGDDDCLIGPNNDISGHCFANYLARGRRSKVHNNNFHHIPGQHAGYYSLMSDFTVNDNMVTDCALSGLKNQISGDGLVASNVYVDDNKIARCGGTAVDLSVATESKDSWFETVSASNNKIKDCAGYGIALDRVRDFTVDENRVRRTGAFSLYMTDSFGSVESNLLKGGQWSAIYASLSQDTTFKDNEILDCALNSLKAVDALRFRYLVQVKRSALALVPNPKYIESRNTYRFSSGTPEPSIFADSAGSVWRFGSGVSTYIRSPWNFTSKKTPIFDTLSDMKVFQAS